MPSPSRCAGSRAKAANSPELVQSGIIINGLPILEGDDGPTLEGWYRDYVVGGTGAFVLPAKGFQDFGNAIRQKFVIEISAHPPPATFAKAE